MLNNLRWRFFIVLGTILFGIYLLIPTAYHFTTGNRVARVPKASDPWWYKVVPSETLKLGLDLKGGLHLAIGIDFEEVYRDSLLSLKSSIDEALKRDKFVGYELTTTANNRIEIKAKDDAERDRIDNVVAKSYGELLDFDKKGPGTISYKMTPTEETNVRSRAIDQSLETLRNRIDEFGVSEPILQRKATRRFWCSSPACKTRGA